jgi:hypothetical protein
VVEEALIDHFMTAENDSVPRVVVTSALPGRCLAAVSAVVVGAVVRPSFTSKNIKCV